MVLARSSSCVRKEEEEELRPTWSRAAIPLRRQQSVPHSGVREALLAPMVAPALPDAVRSSSSTTLRGQSRRTEPDLLYHLPFKNQKTTFINRQLFLCHAVGDKSADHGGSALPLPFKNQNSTFINRQFFLCHAVSSRCSATFIRAGQRYLSLQMM